MPLDKITAISVIHFFLLNMIFAKRWRRTKTEVLFFKFKCDLIICVKLVVVNNVDDDDDVDDGNVDNDG